MCVCVCRGTFSWKENYGECDDISVGVTGTPLGGCMCMEWKSLSPGISRP